MTHAYRAGNERSSLKSSLSVEVAVKESGDPLPPGARHGHRDLGNLAARRADRDALAVAARDDRDRSGDADCRGLRLDVVGGDAARQLAVDLPGGLVPRARDIAAVVGDVARKLEFVAVARATQADGQRGAAAARSVAAATADALAAPVLHHDLTLPGPAAGGI